MSKRRQDYEDSFVDMPEFFNNGLKPMKPTKIHPVFGVFGRLFAFLTGSASFGLLVIVVPLILGSTSLSIAAPAVDIWKGLPTKLDDVAIAEKNVMYDVNGNVFAEVWAENRSNVESIDDISPYAIQGLVDTEDKRFYQNKGFDIIGTTRAAVSGSGGGSGITQQLVKNLQFYNMAGKADKEKAVEYSYSRKIKELKLAMEYDKTHSKDEILVQYFNTVSFGAPNIYSIQTASQYFFGKNAKDLTLAEASSLVGTVQNPSKYNLDKDSQKDFWKSRQKTVLSRMVTAGHITQQEADDAYNTDLPLLRKNNSSGNCASSKYPFYCQYVLDYLKDSPKLGETEDERNTVISKGGLQIKTYLDPATMDNIEKTLSDGFGNDYRVVAPTAVVQPGTGGITGFGANRGYGEGDGNTTINLANNPIGTGSSYKVITLAAALENGFNESSLNFSSSCPFKPRGFDSPAAGFKNSSGCGSFQTGEMDYKKATALSSNTWYLELATKIGMQPIYDLSKNMNLNIPNGVTNRSLSFVLGSGENSPINMAAAYATFSNEGIYCPPTPVVSYTYVDGTSPAVPDTYDPASDSCRRVVSPHTASVVLQALRANTYPGEVPNAFGTDGQIQNYDAVGKSGTNGHFSYSWGQVSKNESLFMAIYDMNKLTNGVYKDTIYKGKKWDTNPAPQAGSDVLRSIVQGKPNTPLDYDNSDTSKKAVTVEKRDFFNIPSVIGMKPEEAVQTLQSVGITAYVSKDKKPKTDEYPSNVIVEQSLEAGTQLPVGTKKEIILYVTE